MAFTSIPDEILAEIFLRLPAPHDVIHASHVCASFRRVVADRSFLRRFRKLHAPPLLGFLDNQLVFHSTVVPYPSTSAAKGISLSFLPARDWFLCDIRDGRVLLGDGPGTGRSIFADIVVCDPLHRRYLLLPPIPGDLAASVEDVAWIKQQHRCYETFLLPHGGDDNVDVDDTSFRLIWIAMCKTKIVTFVFSSSNGQWRAGPSRPWSDLLPCFLRSQQGTFLFSRRQYSNGCFYWLTNWWENFLVLDTRRMEFSSVDAPPGTKGLRYGDVAIVGDGEDMTTMLVRASHTSCHRYTVRKNHDGSYSQWDMVETMSMDLTYWFVGSMGRYVLMYRHIYKHDTHKLIDAGCFSLDIKTSQLERLCSSMPGISNTYIYSNFPPSLLSTPTISSGKFSAASMSIQPLLFPNLCDDKWFITEIGNPYLSVPILS